MKEKPVDILSFADLEAQTDSLLKEGYCCSEAIVKAALERYAPNLPSESACMARGLCGGMGGKKATCGVFTGGAMAIGAIVNNECGYSTKKTKDLSSQFHQSLEQHARGQICGDLRKKMGLRNWKGQLCKQLSKDGARILEAILKKEGLSANR